MIEFVIKNGKVTWNVPTESIDKIDTKDDDIAVMDESREIGCTIEKFRESLKLCKVKSK